MMSFIRRQVAALPCCSPRWLHCPLAGHGPGRWGQGSARRRRPHPAAAPTVTKEIVENPTDSRRCGGRVELVSKGLR